jgi:hypothetical protein
MDSYISQFKCMLLENGFPYDDPLIRGERLGNLARKMRGVYFGDGYERNEAPEMLRRDLEEF